jgi:hypothetical protein
MGCEAGFSKLARRRGMALQDRTGFLGSSCQKSCDMRVARRACPGRLQVAKKRVMSLAQKAFSLRWLRFGKNLYDSFPEPRIPIFESLGPRFCSRGGAENVNAHA